jgi:FKBP-type peptidyl-prolyl cis-trans isomerase FkpA
MNHLAVVVFAVSCLVSCRNSTSEKAAARRNEISEPALKNQFAAANKAIIQKEIDDMDAYERTHSAKFTRNGSGIRIHVYEHHKGKADSIKAGMPVVMNYSVSTLSGVFCYAYTFSADRPFIVEHENAESGIQRGIQQLSKGDKAILLIPSYLAHGLLGDMGKIPPQMPIVCRVETE